MTAPDRIGRYEIVSVLSAGGMGEVYLARFGGLGGFTRHVVLKVIGGENVDADAVAMFLDEARVLGILHHQHIAPVYEIDREGDRLYLVMDYVHGRTAHDVWRRTLELDAELPFDFALTVAAAAASGLHYAHTRRDPAGAPLHIVHRDVSLSNLMIGFDGGVKLIDFGIAKAAKRSAHTQVGFVKGKLGYMAPEQLRGQPVDARTDVFALGIVLYELTTMRRAFREESDRATAEKIKAGAYTRPSEVVEGYPPDLAKIVERALAVDPDARYPDADAMRRELEALGRRLELLLGDAAISEIMGQLFDQDAEPWEHAPRPRASSEGETSIQVASHNETRPSRSPNRRAGELRLRPATEAVDLLIQDLDTPVRGNPVAAIATPVLSAPVGGAVGGIAPPVGASVVASGANGAGLATTEDAAIAVAPRITRPREVINPSAGVSPRRVASVLPVAPRSQRAGWIAATAVGVLAIVAIVADLLRSPQAVRASASAPVDAAVRTDSATVDAAEPPIDAGVSSPVTVRLEVTTEPSGADVLLGARRLGATPLDTTVPAGGKTTLVIRKSRYHERRVSVSLDRDVRERVVLRRRR